jgi:hypothetical protein
VVACVQAMIQRQCPPLRALQPRNPAHQQAVAVLELLLLCLASSPSDRDSLAKLQSHRALEPYRRAA